ncbi:hypothetical protein LXT21_24010 [Myxococcus sp. K38C18041901]|uniref:hypothetical protein n=1 Tax=Myxococcus guangdongensis TaxID=2906760 RepID=UPI0020A7D3E7|nr:hypothetical protein [Myxococcus guangdongensis]MCP3061853.1 hypothetical protein [Myxococcus guangdongensis]
MHRALPSLALGFSVLCLTACPAKAPPTLETRSPPPPPIRVPPGCEGSQAGEYHHEENPAFRYRGEEDGGTLTLAVVRALTDTDAGTPANDSSGASIVLQRTPGGFVGETRATGFTGSGAPCPVAFPTELVACDDAGLTLRAVASTSIDEGCQPSRTGPPPVRLKQVLLRETPDAGP